ncbi:SMODS domain-containing nucleotidyltransferase [Pseudomonas koreensis]|uniref:SMODS domain-containing nucleotidyltransferase n=1 Tax=Pseudomonas koreensis TaxID=198620 RepID=UPI0009EDD1C6|nr:nucleotidyltransferase [Pseudomonas koreensis]
MSATLFNEFRTRLAVKNSDNISTSYKQITKCLNGHYWDSDSDILHCRQVGSYGRHTAIDGVSDLDMLFELPWSVYERFNAYESNGQSSLLGEIKKKLKDRYPTTDITADGQVVVIKYAKYRVELVPVFTNADGTYTYPNTNSGGSWESCDPISEIRAVNKLNDEKNKCLKRLCKMTRAWKNEHGVSMSGYLIDTLCYNFLNSTNDHDKATYSTYKTLVKDFFSYLVSLSTTQESWKAPGSGEAVQKSGNFHSKAKRALLRCTEALDLTDEKKAAKKWKSVFGRKFPLPVTIAMEAIAKDSARSYRDTEQFIDDFYPVDIRYKVEISYDIENQGSAMRALLNRIDLGFKVPKSRKLDFQIIDINVPSPYMIQWKVRNVGGVAEERDMIRGQIINDTGNKKIRETSTFEGEHFVECYVIKDGVCVARDSVEVPI